MALTLFILAAAAVASPVAASVGTDINILHKPFGKDPSATYGNLRRLEKMLESTTEKEANKPQMGSTDEEVEKPQLGSELEADKPKKNDEKENKDQKPKAVDVVVATDLIVEDSTESDQNSTAEVSEVSDLNSVEEEATVEEAAVEDSTPVVEEIREEVTDKTSDESGADAGILAASKSSMTADAATSGALGSGSVGALLTVAALFSLVILA